MFNELDGRLLTLNSLKVRDENKMDPSLSCRHLIVIDFDCCDYGEIKQVKLLSFD